MLKKHHFNPSNPVDTDLGGKKKPDEANSSGFLVILGR